MAESYPRSCEQTSRPRPVLTTLVKILQYRPPAQLIRANYCKQRNMNEKNRKISFKTMLKIASWCIFDWRELIIQNNICIQKGGCGFGDVSFKYFNYMVIN